MCPPTADTQVREDPLLTETWNRHLMYGPRSGEHFRMIMSIGWEKSGVGKQWAPSYLLLSRHLLWSPRLVRLAEATEDCDSAPVTHP
jgi:hypothetical protein